MGSRLGRYAVLKHLASGGMADVLLARSDGIEGFERHVVLKRIRPEHARDARFIRMFLDEARVAATLHHQHVVQVYDIGESGGDYFIAMEYLHGEDVRTILSAASKSRTHTPLGHAIAIVSAAAAGLHYAHDRTGNDLRPLGIVHRDVSPSNILVGYDGSIKVVDFGIAKAAMRDETQSGSLKGKISYMSPEQCKGGDVDRRSDVYALGVVLYELVTTTRLFRGDNNYLVMDQIVHGKVTPPHTRRPDLPRELSDIILRAIAPDRAQRYATADELRSALDQFATKAKLVTSTSAIAAHLRKLFGERPEPWIGLTEAMTEDDDGATMAGGVSPSTSWTEQSSSSGSLRAPGTGSNVSGVGEPAGRGPSSAASRRRGSGMIPRPSDPTAIISIDRRIEAGDRAAATTTPSVQFPTDAKLGWESRPSAPARAVSWPKRAMMGAPLLVLVGVAVWRLTSTSGAAQVAMPAAQPAPPPPPPVVTPLAEPAPTRDAVSMPAITLTDPAADARPSRAAPAAARPTTVASNRTADPPVRGRVDPATAAPPAHAAGTASVGDLARLTAPVVAAPAPAEVTPPVAPVLPPTPVAPAAPRAVAPSVLEALRIVGDRRILPDDSTKGAIARSGREKISGSYKLCIAVDGTVASVSQLTSTGFPSYDETIQANLRRWRYRPYLFNGTPAAVCTAVRFVYSQT